MENLEKMPASPPAGFGKPKKIWQRLKKINRLFLLTVVIPTTASIIYFGLVASDVFISESRFVVRSPQRQSQGSLFGALLQGTGFSRAQDDTYPIIDFIESRDALRQLNFENQLALAYSSKKGDYLSRFPGIGSAESFEDLLKYYQRNVVSINYEPAGAIATLRVSAFSAKDAFTINEKLLGMSEQVINSLNKRAEQDTVGFAEKEVSLASERASQASIALALFRANRSVFDPDKQSAIALQLVSKLQDALISSRAQLAQIRTTSPDNPQIGTLQARISVIEREIGAASASITGGKGSLSDKSVTYESLAFNQEFAAKQLASALASLETARIEAQRKQLYLERLVEPNLPDAAVEPRRMKSIFEVFALGMILWGILSLLLAGIREHHD